MFRWIFSLIRSVVNKVLQLLGISFHTEIEYKLRVHIKTVDGKSFLVDLNPKWNIGQVKKTVSPKVGIHHDQISIIFAGKDLDDTALIEDCDLGQHSFLHAVKLKVVNKNDLPNSNQNRKPFHVQPMCETLLDLQLTSEERETLLKSLDYCAPDYKKKIASFYIYCESPCSSIEKGKLRVRCSDCKAGAFTVDRDPCCWEDVLKPHQVSGTCQVDTCTNAWAEFYFKCSQHLSRGEGDSAVPLCLIKSNFKQIPCLACMDISDPVLVFSCTNGHVICLDCFKQYCKSRLDERRFVWNPNIGYTLPCAAGCENSFIEDINHFRVLENADYSRYLHFGAEEYVIASGGLLCPQPGCGMGLLPDPECRRVQCVGGCGFVFCRDCLQGYHIGDCLNDSDGHGNLATSVIRYTVNPEHAAQARWDADSRTTIRVTSKPCPKCRTPTERDGGCMHMICTRPQCEFHWCWICQTEWTRQCMGNHWFG